MNSIKLENFEHSSLLEQVAVGKTVYSSPEVVDIDHIKWKHLDGPYGKSTVINLRNEDCLLLGRSFLQPRTFWFGPTSDCRGSMVTDLLITPAARNAATLIGMTRAMKSPGVVELVVHTSNEVSDPVYRLLFKYPVACTLMASGLPLYFGNIFRPYLNNLKALAVLDYLLSPWRWSLIFISKGLGLFSGVGFVSQPSDQEVLDIFNDFKIAAGSHFDRNPSFLKWRFIEGPLFNGRVKWIGFKGICIGYLVFKQVQLNGLSVCVLMDIVLRRKLTFMEGVALKLLAVKFAVDAASDALFTLANTNNSALKWLRGFPFIGIPDSLLPHPTPIFIHASEEIYPVLNRKSIYLTLADLDYF